MIAETGQTDLLVNADLWTAKPADAQSASASDQTWLSDRRRVSTESSP